MLEFMNNSDLGKEAEWNVLWNIPFVPTSRNEFQGMKSASIFQADAKYSDIVHPSDLAICWTQVPMVSPELIPQHNAFFKFMKLEHSDHVANLVCLHFEEMISKFSTIPVVSISALFCTSHTHRIGPQRNNFFGNLQIFE